MVNRTLLFVALLSSATVAAQAQPDAQVTIDGARAADRNREAAELFGRALIALPQLHRELLKEWADQLLYSGRSREAIPLYLEVLQSPRDRDERLRATKALGLAYLWTDQSGRARPLFEELAGEQPQDEDISRNLGRALSWTGRQREAERHLAEHIRRHFRDGEAHVQLAQAQACMDRPDESLATLQGVEAAPRGQTAGADREFAMLEYERELSFERSPQPMFIHDRETLRLLNVNDAALRLPA